MTAIPDDRLALVFTCCHPALALDAQVALTLREVGGLDHRGDRARVPRRRSRRSPSGSSGRSAASATPGSRSGCRPTTCCPTGCRASCACSTSSSTRGTRRAPARTLVRTDLCAEAIRLAKLVVRPDAGRAGGARACWRCCSCRTPGGPRGSGRTASSSSSPSRTAALWDAARDRRGPAPARTGPAAPLARPVPAPGGDRRRARPGQRSLGHRRRLRAARGDRPLADRPAQPRGRGRARRRRRGGARARSTRSRGSTATTTCTVRGPTCSAGSAGATRRSRPMTERSALTANETERRFYAGRLDELRA